MHILGAMATRFSASLNTTATAPDSLHAELLRWLPAPSLREALRAWSCGASAPRTRLALASASKGKTRTTITEKKTSSDGLELLFEMLEEDLENDTEGPEDEEFSKEDFMAFEKDLESAFGNLKATIDALDDEETDNDADDDNTVEEDDFDKQRREVNLERWQLKKLAAAAELGRRKVNIKRLAAEIGLDRVDVLYFLKNPPPELLLAARDDTIKEAKELGKQDGEKLLGVNVDGEEQDSGKSPSLLVSKVVDSHKSMAKTCIEKGPRTWVKGKRFRKEHVATFELVYSRTKRPSNAMIENVVELTNLPRRRILEWFDERRQQHPDTVKAPLSSKKRWRREVTDSFSSPRS